MQMSAQAMPSTIELRTSEKPLQASGAKLKSVSAGRYELMVDPAVTADTNHANSNANRPAAWVPPHRDGCELRR